MKKVLFLSVIAVLTLTNVNLSANSVGEKVLLYIPNRIVDLVDIFSVSLGVGPTVRAELMATELIKVGGGYDFGSLRAYKEWNRQYGFGMQEGWYWSFIFAGEQNTTRKHTLGSVDEYFEASAGIPTPTQPIFDYYTGRRDFWRIGGALGFLIEAEVYLNPLEWADLATGFFMIDMRQDDFEVVDFK